MDEIHFETNWISAEESIMDKYFVAWNYIDRESRARQRLLYKAFFKTTGFNEIASNVCSNFSGFRKNGAMIYF